MFYRIIFYCFCLLTSGILQAQKVEKPVPIIFDTDIGPDYDDVGAITLLHALADSGEAEILATIASNKYEGIAPVINLYNTYFNRPDLPIGVPKGAGVDKRDWQHWTDSVLAKYPHEIKRNDEVPGSVEVYRKVLAQQPDTSVTIVTVGFLTNLADLLKSGADQYSKLSGPDLVKQKVKQLVCMAGKFPSGKEFNIEEDAAAGKYAFDNWNTPIIFSGFEIGWNIRTGLPLINNEGIQDSPVKDVFRISIPMAKEDSAGRMSWDETAVLVAIRGYKPYYTLQEGKIVVAEDGSNIWDNNGKNHFYLVENRPVAEVQKIINDLMMHQPIKK